MRPKSTTSDLPSSHDVKVHLHNEFVKYMKGLKEEITVRKLSIIIRLGLTDVKFTSRQLQGKSPLLKMDGQQITQR